MDLGTAKKGIITVGMLLIFYALANLAAMFWFIAPLVKYDIYLGSQSIIIRRFPFFLVLLFSAALLIAGAGIIEFKRWASVTGTVLITVFGIWRSTFLMEYFFRFHRYGGLGLNDVFISILIQLIISIGVLVFLNLPKVKEQFK